MKFQNPQNNHEEKVAGWTSWLWVFLFGPLYWLVKGVMKHALLHFILAFSIIAWFIYPFFTYSILRKHYLRRGWIELAGGAAVAGPGGMRSQEGAQGDGKHPEA